MKKILRKQGEDKKSEKQQREQQDRSRRRRFLVGADLYTTAHGRPTLLQMDISEEVAACGDLTLKERKSVRRKEKQIETTVSWF